MSFTIQCVHAIVSVDSKDGDEGVWGFNTGKEWMPLIAADPERLKSILPLAEAIKAKTNEEYRVLKFSVREDVTEEVKAKFKNEQHE